MQEKLVGLTIHLPVELNEKLKAIAKKENRAVKNLMRVVIQQYIEKTEKK